MLVHVEIPGMSLNLLDPLLRLTGIHPRQTGGIPIGQVFTDCAREGGVQPIRLPGSGTGLDAFVCLIRYQVMRKVHVMFDHPSYTVRSGSGIIYIQRFAHAWLKMAAVIFFSPR